MEITVLSLTGEPCLDWLTAPVAPIDEEAHSLAQQRQEQLTKPPGSLGKLETLATDFAAWHGTAQPVLEAIRIRVFAADHGIAKEGVSAFPQAVTGQMIANFANGGAAISVLSRQLGADFQVVNLGTVEPLPEEITQHPKVRHCPLANGSGNICRQDAMDSRTLARALNAGEKTVCDGKSASLFIGGEMGIGNTATSAALASALLHLPVEETVGRGTGVDEEGLCRKRRAVNRALQLHLPHCSSALETLRRLGGLEIAALTGAYIAAAQRGIPSLVDGYICTVAALLACRINPEVRRWLLFAHRSEEPGHRHVLSALGAQPLLNTGMRLGEGSGAALAVPLLQSALALHNGMATFAEARVSSNTCNV